MTESSTQPASPFLGRGGAVPGVPQRVSSAGPIIGALSAAEISCPSRPW